MDAQAIYFVVDAGLPAVFSDDIAVDGARLQMLVQRAGPVVFHGPEERTIQCPAVFRHFQKLCNQPLRGRVNGNEADLVAFALNPEVHDALPAVDIADTELAQFLAADAVIEQDGEYRAVSYPLQRIGGRGFQQSLRLLIAERRSAALVAVRHRPFDAVHPGCPLSLNAFTDRRAEIHRVLRNDGIDQQPFNPFRRRVLHVRQHVRIGIKCKRDAGMAELLANDLWGDPRSQ